jgi:hypothetical protein
MTLPHLSPVTVEALLLEIIGHLGASIIQSIPTDDQIIMDHVKAAHELAKAARRQLKVTA